METSAQTGIVNRYYRNNMGRFGKGKINSNGEALLEFANRHELVLTNTTFEHKMTHRTTWTGPTKQDSKPVRNQIDYMYILVRIKHRQFVHDSRSYGGTDTYSDHKMVIAKLVINWYVQRKKGTGKILKYNVNKFNDTEIKNKYKEAVKENIAIQDKKNENYSEQEQWNVIVEACHKASEEVIGIDRKNKSKRIVDNEEITKLSEKQKLLRMKIDNEKNSKKRQNMQKERNQIQYEAFSLPESPHFWLKHSYTNWANISFAT